MAVRGTRKSPNKKQKPPRLQMYRRAVVAGQVYIHNDERLFIAPLDNISGGGLFLNGITSLRRGHLVKVVVKSPKLDNALQVKGRIVRIERSNRRGLAVEFTDINAETRNDIERWVHESGLQTAQKVL